jgi:hypothetical protein
MSTFEAALAREGRRSRLGAYLRYWRPGRCAYCGRWTWMILRSEGMHESCWLDLK